MRTSWMTLASRCHLFLHPTQVLNSNLFSSLSITRPFYNQMKLLAAVVFLCMTEYAYLCKHMDSGVTNDDINAIVSLHNQLRNKVATGGVPKQPTASNMKELTWDPQLAKLAQDWADQCNYAHNKPTDKDYLNVGQNIAQSEANYDINKNFSQAIYAWFDECYQPGYPPPGSSTSYTTAVPLVYTEQTGHYTQIVWANTSSVGCGFVKYNPSNPPYTQALYYVCNYGPAGNYIGLNIYNIGKACSDCPNDWSPSKNYLGLCSNKKNR